MFYVAVRPAVFPYLSWLLMELPVNGFLGKLTRLSKSLNLNYMFLKVSYLLQNMIQVLGNIKLFDLA